MRHTDRNTDTRRRNEWDRKGGCRWAKDKVSEEAEKEEK